MAYLYWGKVKEQLNNLRALLPFMNQESNYVKASMAIIIAVGGIVLYYHRDKVKSLFHKHRIIKPPIQKPRGLRNTKETCYMNSMMQALASSSKLLQLLKEFPQNDNIKMFVDVLSSINTPSDNKIGMDETTDKLKKFMNTVQWDRNSQQDAFQLLSYFINAIQKDIERNDSLLPPKLKLLHTFSENANYNKIQDHLALAIPLCGNFKDWPGVELSNLLDEFFEPSAIDDGSHTTSMSFFMETPVVMILHIQANEWSPVLGEYIKPKYFIRYEDILEYTFEIQKKKDGSESEKVIVSYKLVAVVHHMGSVSGGHYITYRMLDGQWFLTNDEQVERIDFSYDIVPYIMVYEKIECQGNVLQHLRVNNCLSSLVHILDRLTHFNFVDNGQNYVRNVVFFAIISFCHIV